LVKRVVTRTLEEYREATRRLNRHVIALDTETDRANGLNWIKAELIGFSVCDGKTAIYHEGLDYLVLNELMIQLEDVKLLIMHNAVYDLKILCKYGINPSCEIFDTMVASHLLDENRVDKRVGGRGHGLKVLAQEYLGADITKYKEAEEAGVHSAVFHEYAQNDAIYTYQLCNIFKGKMEDEGVVDLFRNIEMPFLRTLAKMEMNGVLVDKSKLKAMEAKGKARLTELEQEMLIEIGEKFETQYTFPDGMVISSKVNFGSNKQVADIITKRLGLEISETTKKGALSVGKRTLTALSKKNKFVALLNDYRKLQKLLNAFVVTMPKFIDPDGRIRPSFHNTGTVTGRLSSSKPNFQQLPQAGRDTLGVRSCLIAPQGKKLIALDYNQQELRVMAELSHDEKLIDIIIHDGDLHLINANVVFNLGIPNEYLYKSHPEYEGVAKKYKADRDKGKVFSFGIPYGMGENKLSKDFGVSVEEAKTLLGNFFEGFPELERAIKETHETATKELRVSTFTGRSRHFQLNQWGQLDSKSQRQSFNFLIQSFGADLIRISCVNIQQLADAHPEYEIKILMTVHDEIVVECAHRYAELVAQLCKDKMEQAWDLETVPLVAAYGIGSDYADAK
jgi:DNA polymerase-1